MHILIYGVGAVGGCYGALLARYIEQNPEHQLSFIARAETLKALRSQGIELRRLAVSDMGEALHDETIRLPVSAYGSIDECSSPVDVVLVCVKSRDTIDVAKSLHGKLKDSAYVVSVQNGVENEERLASILGYQKVLACYTNIAAENVAPAIYLQRERYRIVFGELPGNESYKRDIQLAEFMRGASINAKTSTNIYRDLWSKLVWNVGFNPLSALYKQSTGPLIAEHKDTILALMRETRMVAHAQGIMVPDDIVEFHFKNTNNPAWDHFRTSMLQDRLASKPIELDEILGVVIERGRRYGVATPYAEQVYRDLSQAISLRDSATSGQS